MEATYSSETSDYTDYRLHGVISWKIVLFITGAVRTSYYTECCIVCIVKSQKIFGTDLTAQANEAAIFVRAAVQGQHILLL
jgi:hypothetical protein